MKKIMVYIVVACLFALPSYGQTVVNGLDFANNPSNWNGKSITIKDIQINLTNHQAVAVGTPASTNGAISVGGSINAAPTPPAPTPAAIRCNPSKGFRNIDVDFIEKPEFEACFFMSDAMYSELMKKTKGKTAVDVRLTLRGDNTKGYQVTFYRIGK